MMRSYPQVPLILSCNMFFFYNIVIIANKDRQLTMPIMKGYVYDMAFFDDTYPSVTKINVECSKSSKVKWTGKKMKIKVKKLVFVNKLMNSIDKSLNASLTAKEGYSEEQRVCHDLNTCSEFRSKFGAFSGEVHNTTFKQKKGTTKIDIYNDEFGIQVKKTKKDQFGQIARHNVELIINSIPQLKQCETLLKNMCEIPLSADKKFVDKTKSRIPLRNDTYSDEELSTFINVLNQNVTRIVEFALLGDTEDKPQILIEVLYDRKTRNRDKIIVYKMEDIINYLKCQKFTISKSGTVIKLGDSIITIQRKGGDTGRAASNQLQIKGIFSKLDKIQNKLVWKL